MDSGEPSRLGSWSNNSSSRQSALASFATSKFAPHAEFAGLVSLTNMLGGRSWVHRGETMVESAGSTRQS